MIHIDSVDGDVVHFHGAVTISQLDGVLDITGLAVDEDSTMSHEVDQEMLSSVPGTGAGRLLVYIYKKVKELICPECTTTNPN